MATGIDVPVARLPPRRVGPDDHARLGRASSRSGRGQAGEPGQGAGRRPRRRGRPRRCGLPDFEQDHAIYLYFTASKDNRVVRMTFERGEAEDPVPILTGIPKAGNQRRAASPSAPTATSTSPPATPVTVPPLRTGTRSGARSCGSPRPASPPPETLSRVAALVLRPPQRRAWGGTAAGGCSPASSARTPGTSLNLIKPGQNYGWPVVEGRPGARTSSTCCGSGAPTRRRRAASRSRLTARFTGGAARGVALADPSPGPGSLVSPSGSLAGGVRPAARRRRRPRRPALEADQQHLPRQPLLR